MKKYAKDNQLNYLNTIADSNIESKYGVNSYPTTFLIDKKGKIIQKNLRGHDLAESVKDLIYKNN